MVQWLRLCTSKAGGPGLIPGQGTKIPHVLESGQKKKKKKKVKKKKETGTQGLLNLGRPQTVLLSFSSLFSLILLNPDEGRWQERVNKVLDREISRKLKQGDSVPIINKCCFVCGNLLQEKQETKTIEYSPLFSAESFIPLATKYPGQKLQVS